MPAVTTPPGEFIIEMDILVRVLGTLERGVGPHQVGEMIIDLSSQKYYPVFQKP